MSQQPPLLFGRSPAMIEVLHRSERFARSRYPLLILGERGTGKTALARRLHELSARPGHFVREHAPGIPIGLASSHLGGHARGTFTGAIADRKGRIESAHRGTFFLDELGLAPLELQGVLLQFLDHGEVLRFGEERPRPVDVRIIAATNADLDRMMDDGSFRRDLRDRFGHLTIRLPLLAERRDEILPLVCHYLEREFRALERPDAPVLSKAVQECLEAAPWPDNVRGVERLCQFLALMAESGRPVELYDLPDEFVATVESPTTRPRRHGSSVIVQPAAQRQSERVTAEALRAALHRARGNKSAAARLLGITRQHVHRLCRQFGEASETAAG